MTYNIQRHPYIQCTSRGIGSQHGVDYGFEFCSLARTLPLRLYQRRKNMLAIQTTRSICSVCSLMILAAEQVSILFGVYRIIGQLENLKKEAAEIQKKVEETDVIMAEVERVSQQYLPLSTSCSSLYFTLDTLNQVGSI